MENTKKIPAYKKGFTGLKRHLTPFKKQIIVISILGVISAAANGAVPYVTGLFFDQLISLSNGQINYFYSLPLWAALILVWLLVQMFANGFDFLIDLRRSKIDSLVHMSIVFSGFKKIFRLPISFHRNEKINQVLEKLSMAGWRTSSLVRSLISILPQFLSIIIGFVLAASINIFLASIMLVAVFVYSLTLIKILKNAAEVDEEGHKLWNEAWGDAATVALQIDSVKQSTSEDHEENKLKNSFFDALYKSWTALDRIWINISFFQRVIVFLTQLSIFILSINFIMKGQLTVGELIALNAYASMFFGPFVSLGSNWQNMQNAITTLGQAEHVFDQVEEVYEPKQSAPFQKIIGEIAFNHVKFSYGPDQPMVLEDISFKTHKGELVALVGESGGGKSTLIALISGYYFPNEGTVTIDGVDTRNYNLKTLRSQIAVVPQEVALFNDSIKNNIRYGNFEVDDKKVFQAAKESHIHEFIETLPDRYETLVGERGIKLSVGQKQRLAIARAILRDPKILILDEPTSALDSKTEKNISESLEKIMSGRTTFVIAHRLSTVRKADTILVFDKGKISEQGKHKDLINLEGGVYKKLHDYQIGLS
jgi:ABC-type multidrug transport system fused ATPase/permease subunit